MHAGLNEQSQKLGGLVLSCDPSALGTEVGGSRVPGCPGLCSETLFQNNKNKTQRLLENWFIHQCGIKIVAGVTIWSHSPFLLHNTVLFQVWVWALGPLWMRSIWMRLCGCHLDVATVALTSMASGAIGVLPVRTLNCLSGKLWKSEWFFIHLCLKIEGNKK